VVRLELREVMPRKRERQTRRHTSAVARALAACFSLFCVIAAQAQVPLPRPPLLGDPTGRSSEPPPLYEELPRPVPAPGQLLAPVPPPQPREPGALPGIAVFVREIRVHGSTVFTPEQLAAVTGPYTNRQLTAEDLEALRVALTRLYIERGYVNSGVVLPDQTVTGGVITYQAIEGKLSRTEIEGNRWLRAGYYRERLALGAGPPLNVDALQERLQLMLENPRIERLNAELKPGVSPAEAVLDVRVQEQFPIKLWFDFDNYQAPSVGAERGIVTLAHQSLTGNGDTLALSYGRSQGLNPLLDFAYAIPFTARDTTFAIQYRRNDLTVVEEPFAPLDIQSNSEIYTVALRQPVYAGRARADRRAFVARYLGAGHALQLGTRCRRRPICRDGLTVRPGVRVPHA
jgi:hemolysin activation/secretion protein